MREADNRVREEDAAPNYGTSESASVSRTSEIPIEDLISYSEAAKLLKKSKGAIKQIVRRNSLTPVKIGGINFLVRADLLNHKPYSRQAKSVTTTEQQDISGKPTGHICLDAKCNPFGTMRQIPMYQEDIASDNLLVQENTSCKLLNPLGHKGTFLIKSVITKGSDIECADRNVTTSLTESVTPSERCDIFGSSMRQNVGDFCENQPENACNSLNPLGVDDTFFSGKLGSRISGETDIASKSVTPSERCDILGKVTPKENSHSPSLPKFFTPLELSKKLNYSDRLIRKFITKGKIKAERAGSRWLIPEDSASAFINEVTQRRLEEQLIEQAYKKAQREREKRARESNPSFYWFREFALEEWGAAPIGSVKSLGGTVYHKTHTDLATLLDPYQNNSRKQFFRDRFTDNFVNGGEYLIGTILDFIRKNGIETVINIENIEAVERANVWLSEQLAGFDFSGKMWKKSEESAN